MSDTERYAKALHAVQSGVATLIELERGPDLDPPAVHGEASPKHLRVGVNSALIGNGAIAELLINKGIFTQAELESKLADFAEREQASYEKLLSAKLGSKISLA